MKILREPLLHFALLGAFLFAGHAWLNRDAPASGEGDRTIQITERELAWLSDASERAWQRPPTDEELQGLVAEYLREEMLAREARELELDRDDTVVRRRLAQKMNFILEDTARLASPTEADLRARFDADPARFRTLPGTSFHHIYFSTAKRGDDTASDAKQTLTRLLSKDVKVDAAQLGDGTLLPASLADVGEPAIAAQFGVGFARAVATMPAGTWQGPIESEFGLHLVLVTARYDGRPRSFEEVRTEIQEEWRREQHATARSVYFSGLLRKYEVQATESTRHLLGPALSLLTGDAP